MRTINRGACEVPIVRGQAGAGIGFYDGQLRFRVLDAAEEAGAEQVERIGHLAVGADISLTLYRLTGA